MSYPLLFYHFIQSFYKSIIVRYAIHTLQIAGTHSFGDTRLLAWINFHGGTHTYLKYMKSTITRTLW